VNYRIAADAPDGTFDITLDVTQATTDVEWTPTDPDFVTSFEVDRTAPRLTVVDHRGRVAFENAGFDRGWVRVEGLDVRPDGKTPGSGVARIELASREGFKEGRDFPGVVVSTSASFPLANGRGMPDGHYTAKVIDRAGNAAALNFRVRRFEAILCLGTPEGVANIRFTGTGNKKVNTLAEQVSLNFQESLDGVTNVSVTRDGEVVCSELPDPATGEGACFLTPVGLKAARDGEYTFRVRNRHGEEVSGEFRKYVFTVRIATESSRARFNVLLDNTKAQFTSRLFAEVFTTGPGVKEISLWEGGKSESGLLFGHKLLSRVDPGGTSRGTFDMEALVPLGGYLVKAKDENLEVQQALLIEPFRVTLTESRLLLAKPAKAIGVEADPERGELSLARQAGGAFFEPTGSLTTQAVDLFADSAGSGALGQPAVKSVPGSIGGVMEVTLDVGMVAAGQTAVEPKFGEIGNTGMQAILSVASGDTPEESLGPFETALDARLSASVDPEAGPTGQILRTITQTVGEFRIGVKRHVRFKFELKRSDVTIWIVAAGAASPLVSLDSSAGPAPETFKARVAAAAVVQGRSLYAVASAERVAGGAEFEVRSTVAGITVRPDIFSPENLARLELMADTGRSLVGRLFVLDPVEVLNADAVVQLAYDPASLGGVDEESLALYAAEPGGNFVRRPIQGHDRERHLVSSLEDQITLESTWGLFGTRPSGGAGAQGAGLAIGADAQGRLWLVVEEAQGFKLTRWSGDGSRLESQTLLPGARGEGNWTLRFDGEGNAYAVGSSTSALSAAGTVSVYKATPEGVLASSAAFAAGPNASAIAFDATGDLWITGAILEQGAQGFSAKLGLWKYCFHGAGLKLVNTYSRGGGIDVGFGIRLLNGELWIAGYSADPSPASGAAPVAPALDLALWRYDGEGKALVAGPYIRPGYLAGPEVDLNLRLEVSTSALYVAASRSGSGQDTDLALLKFGLDGSVLMERKWSSSAGAVDIPGGMALDAAGVTVVGRVGGFERPELGVWRYGLDGSFVKAETVAGISGARGVAALGGDLWLAHGGSSRPVKLAGTTALAGTDVLLSSAAPRDVSAPVTTLHIGSPSFEAGDGSQYVSTSTPISLEAVDPGPVASGVEKIEVAIDTDAFSTPTASFTLAEGRHIVSYRAVDKAGNVEAGRKVTLLSDGTAPQSALTIGQPQASVGSQVVVSSLTQLMVAATDTVSAGVASGIGASFAAISATGYHLVNGPFALAPPDGEKTITFYSQDNVLNAGAAQGALVTLDSTPPELALLSPAGDNGVCSVVQGTVTVIGTARDMHFNNYVLEAAQGRDGTEGFKEIFRSSAPVSGAVLASWDTAAVLGWQSLRLQGQDLVANAAMASANVFVGEPAQLLELSGFNKPGGTAYGPDQRRWIADTNHDAIFVAGDDGVSRRFSTAARLNKPEGIAVDSAGNVYVADTNNDRVVKLSPGGALLLELGGFNKPGGVALGRLGNICVADSNNHRVAVYSPGGAQVASHDLGPGSKPSGIAVDGAGNIYVADKTLGRALRLDSAGKATLELKGLAQPLGIAVDASGDCLVVAVTNDNVLKRYDRFGNAVGTFAPGFNKPAGLALGPGGRLLVADRNRDAVRELGAPGDAVLGGGPRTGEARPKADRVVAAPSARVFPNPVRGSGQALVRVQPGLVDEVALDFYSPVGERIAGARVSAWTELDDGSGLKYTYDYSWSLAGVRSGVYVIRARALRGGSVVFQKLLRLAVIK